LKLRELVLQACPSFLVSLAQGETSVLNQVDLITLTPFGGLLLPIKVTDLVEGFL
jgi:hypothetical protein